MTKQLEHRAKPTTDIKEKAKSFCVKNLRPTLFEGTMGRYSFRREHNQSRTRAFAGAVTDSVKVNYKLWLIRTVSALGVYTGLNKLYGARSWATKDLSAERMIYDSGPVARAVAAKASAMITISSMQPERMTTVANTLLAVEFGMCCIRMAAEQIAWRKTKFSGEVAGTGGTPLLAFSLFESLNKAIEKYPKDPLKRFAIAVIGMWGNFVRIVHSSLIIAFGNKLWNAVKPKPPQGPAPGEKRNEYGFPVDNSDHKSGDHQSFYKDFPHAAA